MPVRKTNKNKQTNKQERIPWKQSAMLALHEFQNFKNTNILVTLSGSESCVLDLSGKSNFHVLSNSKVWKCSPWYGDVLEITWKYSGNRTPILWNRSSFSSGLQISYWVYNISLLMLKTEILESRDLTTFKILEFFFQMFTQILNLFSQGYNLQSGQQGNVVWEKMNVTEGKISPCHQHLQVTKALSVIV